MDTNSKSRGIENRKNKSRYRTGPKVIGSVPQPKKKVSQKDVQNNWDRYEEPEVDAVDESTSFSFLSQAPLLKGGYFQFSDDKEILSEEFEGYQHDEFHFNEDKLSDLLATIPLYERYAVDQKYFKAGELKRVDDWASAKKVELISETHISRDASDDSDNEPDEFCEILNAVDNFEETPKVEMKISREEVSKETVEDLDQWLSDILKV